MFLWGVIGQPLFWDHQTSNIWWNQILVKNFNKKKSISERQFCYSRISTNKIRAFLEISHSVTANELWMFCLIGLTSTVLLFLLCLPYVEIRAGSSGCPQEAPYMQESLSPNNFNTLASHKQRLPFLCSSGEGGRGGGWWLFGIKGLGRFYSMWLSKYWVLSRPLLWIARKKWLPRVCAPLREVPQVPATLQNHTRDSFFFKYYKHFISKASRRTLNYPMIP